MTNKKIAFFDATPYDRYFFEMVNKDFDYDIKFFNSPLTYDNIRPGQGCRCW